jgi:hypothetical protein
MCTHCMLLLWHDCYYYFLLQIATVSYFPSTRNLLVFYIYIVVNINTCTHRYFFFANYSNNESKLVLSH